MIVPAEQIVGIHKKDGALVINNGESLSFCRQCLADVPDAEVEFDEQRPCVICQVHGGPVLHARILGVKHDYVTPQPEIVPFSDAELAESRAQIDNMKNSRLKMQIQRLYATVDYWMSEARREVELRQPAIDERDIAQRALETMTLAVDEVVKDKLAEAVAKFRADEAAEQERQAKARKRFFLWPFPLPLFGRIVSVVVEVIREEVNSK